MNKKLILIVLAVLVVAGGWLYQRNYQEPGSDDVSEATPTPTPTSSSVSNKPRPTPASTPVVNLTYSQAVEQYASRRIQFDAACQGTPSSPVYKNGTSVMFDNRSGDARWIALDGRAYYLDGYGFKILTLTSQTLPHYIYVDCGAAKNAMRILLQD